jgi:hypothetical protein
MRLSLGTSLLLSFGTVSWEQVQAQTGGGGPPGEGEGDTTTTSCTTPPCPAALLGNVGFTTVSGKDERTGAEFYADEDIFGPFEAGFSALQADIISQLGCSDPSVAYVDGGIDTYTAEQIVAFRCGITLPRMENDRYISLLDECGGHTAEYHFHERLSCLYDNSPGVASIAVGVGVSLNNDEHVLYGTYDNNGELPLLDACGGSFAPTPGNPEGGVYHYHVQVNPPFTFGCYGPILDDPSGLQKLVTVAECRALYDECGNGDEVTITTKDGTFLYDIFCPCFDADGSNVGNVELSAFAEADSSVVYGAPVSSYPLNSPSTSSPVASSPSSPSASPVASSAESLSILASTVKISRIRDWLDEAHNLLMLLWLFPSVYFVESYPCLL